MGIFRLLNKLIGSTKIQMSEAINVGDMQDVRKPLMQGIDVNQTGYDGSTYLLLAVIDGHEDSKSRMSIVSALITAGADVNLKDFSDRSPLGAALYFNHGRAADSLRKAGARE